MNWSIAPALTTVTILVCAFASVSRSKQTAISKLWLTGWLLVATHFLFALNSGTDLALGSICRYIAILTLIAAAHVFQYSAVKQRGRASNIVMFFALTAINAIYLGLLLSAPSAPWILELAAASFIVVPALVVLFDYQQTRFSSCYLVVALNAALCIVLYSQQLKPQIGAVIAINALLFTGYFGVGISFFMAYRRATTGSFITLLGFLLWAMVFVVAPIIKFNLPHLEIESSVWNLPKYIVAVGMILLQLEDQIADNRYLALHDELTGLANLRLFQDRMQNALHRARRNEERVALLVIDLDLFKEINDNLGHHMGDLLLRNVSQLFLRRVRRSDTVARTGGDEFSIILEEPTSIKDAEEVADSLLSLLNDSIQLGEHCVRVGASIGVAVFPDNALDEDGLRVEADRRMYELKKVRRLSAASKPIIEPCEGQLNEAPEGASEMAT